MWGVGHDKQSIVWTSIIKINLTRCQLISKPFIINVYASKCDKTKSLITRCTVGFVHSDDLKSLVQGCFLKHPQYDPWKNILIFVEYWPYALQENKQTNL